MNKKDSARVRWNSWMTASCVGLVVVAGLVAAGLLWVTLHRGFPQTHDCKLSEIAAYTGLIFPENTALLGCKFWAWGTDFSTELVAKVRFKRRALDSLVNSLPGEPSKLGPPWGGDMKERTVIKGVGAWWNPDAARDYTYIAYRYEPDNVDVEVLIDLDDKEYATVFVMARWSAL